MKSNNSIKFVLPILASAFALQSSYAAAVNFDGGAGGTSQGGSGTGGNGGVGRVRIDTFDGSVAGIGIISPTPQIFTATALPSLKAKFKSRISY